MEVYMRNRKLDTSDEAYMVGVFFVMALVALALFFAGCSGCATKQGTQGIQGIPGVAIPVSSQPADVSICPAGGIEVTVGNSITDVCNGIAGATGAKGTQGQSGTNATPITIVQLCPGFVPSYPNIFPESALCIDSQLYGVYSANGGFLALLTPGTYSSDGINASCNLTILPNCVVQ